MNRSELVEAIALKSTLARKQAEIVVNTVFESMFDALVRDERIEIRGFGSFTNRHYESYTGRNPKTGTAVEVPSKRLPFFKVGKDLRDRVNCESGDDKE
ncbi:MAG: integration host factor subunit beta [Myxococcales bacterium]|nr:integration host factor subunit beta [Myxococcales bacterium]